MKNIEIKDGIPDFLNFLGALIVLICLSPIFIISALLVKITSKGPIFFKQKRMGKNFKEFEVIKFRTMYVGSDGLKITRDGDPRITKVGKILRKTKIDELPQLINVLRGEMAFVGPRPEVKEYVDLYPEQWKQILKVKPGITDPITIKLRNEEKLLASFEKPDEFYKNHLLKYKINGYLTYLRNRNMFYDFYVIFLTVLVIFFPHLVKLAEKDEILNGFKNE